MTAPDTVALVPLAELLDLARLGKEMRRAQRAFFEQRKQNPHTPATAALAAARDGERRFDAAIAKVLAREKRPSMPGLDAG